MARLCAYNCGKEINNTARNHKYYHGHKPWVIKSDHPCACGCGELVPSNRKYVNGHNGVMNKNRIHSPEEIQKQKDSVALSRKNGKRMGRPPGGIPWNKGLTGIYSEETLYEMGNGRRGKTSPFKGKHHKEESKAKQSLAKLEGEFIPWNKGLTGIYSEETLYSMGSCRGKFGELAPNWKGGKSFEEYGVEFDKDLKIAIRERDGFHCRNYFNDKNGLHVHHIDYDKKNSSPDNLITLCKVCHLKTNGKKNREYWTIFYKAKMVPLSELDRFKI